MINLFYLKSPTLCLIETIKYDRKTSNWLAVPSLPELQNMVALLCLLIYDIGSLNKGSLNSQIKCLLIRVYYLVGCLVSLSI